MEISKSIDIDAPPDAVWTILADVERWHEWTDSVTSVAPLGSGGIAVGARYRIKQPRLAATVLVVQSIVPGRSFLWASAMPGMRFEGDHTIEPTATGSRVTLTARFRGPVGGIMGRLVRGLTDRYVTMEAEGLKRRAEGR